MITSYRCSLCDCVYNDHGSDDPSMHHRRVMASLRVATWEEAEQLIKAGNARVVTEDPSWEGQVCGDRSGQPRGEECSGRLVPITER